MFDVAPTELLLVAGVALLVIGPKDLPKAMRFVGFWVGRARGVARQFRSGFDEMVREAEFDEMQKKWAAENERIMREHPQTSLPAPDENMVEMDPATYVEPPAIAPEPPIVSVEAPVVSPADPELPLGSPAPAKPRAKRKPKAKTDTDVAPS